MFTDANGVDWSTAVTVATIGRVQERAGVLLTNEQDIERVRSDLFLRCNVLCAVCKPQANERDIDSATFGALLVGDVIDKASVSLFEDIVSFFPSSRRPVVQRILAATETIENKRMEAIESRLSEDAIEKMVAKSLADLDKELSARTGEPSGSSPESSA